MYRPPDSTVTYWERLDGALHKAALLTPSMTVLGDFNVDVGAGTTSPHYQRFSDFVASYGLRNLVTTATRTTPQCPNGKIIDLILTSCDDARSCAVVPSTLSDHDAVQVLLGLHVQVPRQACNSRKPFRNVRRIHIPDFRDDLDAAHLDTWPPNTTVDDMWSIWHYKLLAILDKHAPLQCSSAKRKQLPPWSDRHLFQLTQRKNRLHRRWRGDKANAALHTAFKRARAEARNAYRQKRNTYFQGQCTANAGNTKKLWRTINKVTCRDRPHVEPSCTIEDVASAFHKVVTDDCRPQTLSAPLGPPPRTSLPKFSHVSIGAVERLLQQVNPAKATGSDGVPGAVLKLCSDVLAPSVTSLFNASLSCGHVPSAFKLANVIPLHKSGDPSLPTNFRPVSLLPILSKLLEKLVQKELITFLDITASLPTTQFAFRRGHSTEDALVLMSNRILTAKDQGLFTGVCLLDMSKAFDKVQHDKLLQDLHSVGVSGTALDWFASYLSGRTQRVCLGSRTSSISACTSGVPQGSVLGPILFSLYTREVPAVVGQSESVQFADDIALACSRRTAQEVSDVLSASVSILADWLKDRGLILNAGKNQVVPIPAGRQHTADLQVICHDTSLPSVPSARYLGATIDSGMSWHAHIAKCSARVSQKIGALWRMRRCLNHQSRMTYFRSLIMSDLLYASNAYSSSLQRRYLDRLQVLQNSGARAVFGRPPWSSARDLLERIAVFRVAEVFNQKLAYLVWRCRYALASPELQALLTPAAPGPTGLQSAMGLCVPVSRSVAGRGRFACKGAVLWNALPSDIRAIHHARQFRTQVIPYTCAL